VLSEAGYTPIVTGDPSELEHLLETGEPQLVLLNLVLPGTDGFELMKSIPNVSEVPVIFISGRGEDQYVARAFEMGAADYILKPFSPTELVARIKAALRKRAAARHAEPYLVGDLAIDHVERSVTVAGRPADLTPTEYKLLYELSRNAGRVFTHDELLQLVWGEEHPGSYHLLRSFVKSLRQKLGDDARSPSYIFTEPGAGYRLTRS
jgi:two-component system KDP operon response regulator KdpE